ncbi:hypothetical protein [Alicyclobacillus ferrooxydans]|uniref:Uncharacterized protein n=1 Tax=Alicyclobacillus ferrooxydans TaxID=471514 RepID=A0A0P9ELW6_9BACL|nr:hypothetical protein [Alicyclobacillus ferrooxydans]KPV44302.1 hypothetical protein AN477_07810 [Alicyclobacillus ferrooxydans]
MKKKQQFLVAAFASLSMFALPAAAYASTSPLIQWDQVTSYLPVNDSYYFYYDDAPYMDVTQWVDNGQASPPPADMVYDVYSSSNGNNYSSEVYGTYTSSDGFAQWYISTAGYYNLTIYNASYWYNSQYGQPTDGNGYVHY